MVPPKTDGQNITLTKATLGRTATMKCAAKNLVGQKTVGNVKNFPKLS